MIEVGGETEGTEPSPPARTASPVACVLGDTDLVRPLGLAGIRCAVVSRPHSPKAYSRFVDARIDWADNWADAEHMRANLLAFAAEQPVAPALFYQYDGDLLFVSHHREVLAERFRFAIADAELIEQLVDKTRFRELAAERGLPVPATAVVWPAAEGGPPDLPLEFPVILNRSPAAT